ncbi:sensor histidine kinase [Streptomyces venezuelae]|uniref:sensor histidine kinase n=1 Tax=Streptomyces venezuelae TaxID=54571 RepID=UPI003665596B
MRAAPAASRRSRLLLLLSVAAAYAQAWLFLGHLPSCPYAAPLTFLLLGALFFRHRTPFAVLLVTLPLCWLQGPALGTLIALHTVALRCESFRRRVTAAALVFLVSVSSYLRTAGWGGDGLPFGWPQILMICLGAGLQVGLPMTIGTLIRARADLAERLAELTRAREREHALLVERALSAERARLAREMHDVVAHQVSLINVQAGALQVTTADPRARELASCVRRLSAQALDELRRTVGVLRASGAGTDTLAPQPLLRDLPALIAAGGPDTEADIRVPLAGPWHEAVQRAAYRTVQEGLTNARKHAPGARVAVRLHEADHHLHVEVRSGRPDPAAPLADLTSGGFGLIGLRERAQLLNGTLTSGPDGDDGFLLHAAFPTCGGERSPRPGPIRSAG